MGILDLFRGSRDTRIARRYMEVLRQAGETRRMQFDAPEEAIRILNEAGEVAESLYITNLKLELKCVPERDHDAVYDRYAKGVRDSPARDLSTYEAAQAGLYAVLKDRAYPDYIDLMQKLDRGSSNAVVWGEIAPDLVACVVADQENSIRFLGAGDLERWAVSAEQVLAGAVANVRALGLSMVPSGPLFLAEGEDVYIASRLLSEAEIRKLPLAGRPVAVVPDRQTLAIAGSEDVSGLVELARLVKARIEVGERLISARPVVLTDSGWQDFEPPEPARVEFANQRRVMGAVNWSQYQELLEKDFQAKGEDIFVAKLSVYSEPEAEAYYTSFVWSKGVDSIFPASDRVLFYEAEGLPIRAAQWKDVRRVMGDKLQRQEGLPERYRTSVFPTAAEFAAMGAKVAS